MFSNAALHASQGREKAPPAFGGSCTFHRRCTGAGIKRIETAVSVPSDTAKQSTLQMGCSCTDSAQHNIPDSGLLHCKPDRCLCTASGFTPAGTRWTGRSRLTGRCARRRRGPQPTSCRRSGTAWRSGETPSQVRPAVVKKTTSKHSRAHCRRVTCCAVERNSVPSQGWRSGQPVAQAPWG